MTTTPTVEPRAPHWREWASVTDHVRHPLFRNAYALILNSGLSGLIGLLYWVVAAHLYSATVIGENTALIAALQTLSTVGQLDLASLMVRLLPTWRDNSARALRLAYLIAALASVVLSIGFVVIAPRVGSHWAFLRPIGIAAPLCCAVGLWSVFSIEDGALTGLRRATLVPIENSTYGVLKLLLVVTLATILPTSGVFFAWVLALIPVALVVNWFLFRRALPAHAAAPLGEGVIVLDRRRLLRYATCDYLGALCGTTLTVGMPLIVTGVLGVREGAIFYFPWTFILLMDAIATSLGASLSVEGTTDPSQLVQYGRKALRQAALLLVPAMAALAAFAPLFLRLFGSSYSHDGATTLRILALALIPRAVVSLYTSIARVRLKVAQILVRVTSATVVTVVLVIVLGQRYGINGLAAGWLLGSVLELAVIAGPLWRAVGPPRRSAVPALDASTVGGEPPGSVGHVEDSEPETQPNAGATEAVSGALTDGPDESGRSATVLRASLYAALAVVGLASAATLVAPPLLRSILGLGAVLVVPGAALTSRLHLRSVLTEVLLVVTSSAALSVVGGDAMLTFQWWMPRLWTVTVASTAGVVLALQSLHLLRQRNKVALSRRSAFAAAIRISVRPEAAFAALCLAAVALWLVSLSSINPAAATDAGLIGEFPLTFFLALAVLTAALGLALSRGRSRPWELAVLVGLLVWMLYAIAPLIAAMPRYTYVYKHLGVVAYLNVHGATRPALDIYQNWPGFFALLAMLERVSGISGLSLAAWGQVAFAVIDALAVRYAVRGLTSDKRVVGLATWLYVLADWVGQNYLSPQAFGFAVTVTIVGVVLHHLPPSDRKPRRITLPRWFGGGAVFPPLPAPESPLISPRIAVGIVVLLGAAVAVSHQLSPLMLAALVAILVVTRRCSMWWLPVVLLLLTLAQYARSWNYLTAHHLIFSGLGQLAANSAGASGGLPASGGHLMVEHAARILSLGLWIGSAAAVAVRRRRGYWEVTSVGLLVAPFGLLALQSYGGEGIYRVYLFTTPWAAYLIASALVGVRHRRAGVETGQSLKPASKSHQRRQAGLAVALSAALIPLWLTAFYGLYRSDYVRPSEVAADYWFASHAPPGSVLDFVCGNFPVNATANYDLFQSPDGTTFGTDVVSQPGFEGRALDDRDVPAAIDILRAHDPGRPIYLALNPGQEAYAESFGLSPKGNVARFEAILANSVSHQFLFQLSPKGKLQVTEVSSPLFQVVFHQGTTTILKLDTSAVVLGYRGPPLGVSE